MPLPQIDFDPSIDYYVALGIVPDARSEDVKRAYHQLARQLHPDTTGGDKSKELRFQGVQRAYDVLGDPSRRRLYDELRARARHAPRGTYTIHEDSFSFSSFLDQIFRPPQDEDVFEPVTKSAPNDQHVRAKDGAWLRVEGIDVYSDVRISFERAIVGTTTTVGTLEGSSPIKIPPGTSSGTKFRLRGKGIGKQPKFVGDHYVTVHIDVPREDELDDEARVLLVRLVEQLSKKRA
jgi:DnaJ-class molecular chaperone